ncbi:DUF4203 domain-containing protein [Mediterraneibacter gnavus]|uniref:DUF4203 domain-containing protein n=1 Tax=Mediterraneibacter gnavus TaxID=33038 RepID=UPI000E4CD904|nr:DUF4203 domain-containing protein [Mediterraneibacter gnavus]MDB8697937.1 DUF4203 domain-containing protein [Mediterraneibacter gnavus]RHE73342.1 TMEM198/TM7SF3 family protein [Mediterraneibacter gnavus]
MDMINEIGRWLQEKEVLPTALERLGMADKLAEIVLISLGITVLLGILSCFFGLKLARFWSFLTVFVIGTGAAAAVAMQITSDETLSGIIGLAAGIILAIVFAILKRAGMFVTAFVLGAALSIYWLRPANLIWLLVCVGIGLVFALLTIKLFVPVLMLLTGVTGAVCISQAGTVLLGHAGVELERWMVTLAFAVLAVLGILVQFLMESGKRQKLHLKKAAEIREQNSTENEVDKARALLDEEFKEEKQAEKEVHTAAVPHAEELEMEFEDDDEDEEDEEVMKEDLIVSEEIVTEDEYLDKDLDEDFDEDLDEFWDDEDNDVEIVEIDLSDQDDEDK